ncbi:aromatic acid exporter family protein [Streptomyces luteogriseus]|uniref:aromatic acid exporter family protein n=1 Tax=Streptomyces luteogriseus TaxID=68233 RepID=UPI00379D01A6
MAGAAAGARRLQAAFQGRLARMTQWFGRAGSGGHERHTLALLGKSTLAATVSWVIANDVMAAQSPAFAPFSAVLIMQVTVYRSLVHALRCVGAVAVGVGLQGVVGLLAGPHLLTFVLVTLAALAIGRWRPLGSQGSQVATAAFFAFSTYVSATSDAQRWSQLGQIIALVLIGCGIGVVVNTLVLPPLRYRSAEYGIHTLAHSLYGLVRDMYPALREGKPERERTRQWRLRAAHLAPIVQQAQSSIHTARESTLYNPRRLRRRHRHRTSFDGYQAVVDALERVSHQVASMTRSFDQWHDADAGRGYADFARAYGDFLASLAPIAELLSQVDEDHLQEQSRQLCEAAEQAQRCRDRLEDEARAGSLALSDPAQPYGILMAEAARLTDEFQYTCQVLKHGVAEAQAAPTAGSEFG